MTNSDAIIKEIDDAVDRDLALYQNGGWKALIVKTALNATKAVAARHGLTLADIDDIDGFLSMPYVPLETKEVAG